MHPRVEYWGFRHADSRMISVQFHASSVNISEIYGAEARQMRDEFAMCTYINCRGIRDGGRETYVADASPATTKAAGNIGDTEIRAL